MKNIMSSNLFKESDKVACLDKDGKVLHGFFVKETRNHHDESYLYIRDDCIVNSLDIKSYKLFMRKII